MKLEHQFVGYQPPTSNTTYTPNQFFDVVLPHSSRGVVRLVAYMIRKSLGWCDVNGNPQEPQVLVSYRELIEEAGIGRARIKEAIDEAILNRYIACLREGRPNTLGSLGMSAMYELNWDERDEYTTDLRRFNGFYAGNGNLTYIPNDFFDYTVPTEPLAVVRVVGAIIRHTIGFQTRYGMRRQQIAMSYTELQRRTRLTPRSVSLAIQQGLDHNHIVRIEQGFFDTNAGLQSKATVYGVKWIDRQLLDLTGPVKVIEEPETLYELNPETSTVPKVYRDTDGSKSISGPNSVRFQKYSGNGSVSVAGGRFQKCSDIEIKHENNTIERQQQPESLSESVDTAVAVVCRDEHFEELKHLLTSTGFDTRTAERLVRAFPADRIRRQVEWLPKRCAAQNRIGMLRKAIEEDWCEPLAQNGVITAEDSTSLHEAQFVSHFYAAWAGSTETPTALPSRNDIESGKLYVARLQEIATDATRLTDLARDFGVFVRDAEANNPKALRSFVVAVRTHGDEFYLSLVNRRKKDRKQAIEQAKKSHEQCFADTYRDYLKTREMEIRAGYPEDYQAFSEESAASRRRLTDGPFAVHGAIRDRLLCSFDSEDSHLERLREFCGKRSIPVLDFWEWDKEMNPDAFNPGNC